MCVSRTDALTPLTPLTNVIGPSCSRSLRARRLTVNPVLVKVANDRDEERFVDLTGTKTGTKGVVTRWEL